MDYKTIVNLMKEMSNTELTKLEIEEEGFRICIENCKKEEGKQGSPSQLTWSQNAIPAMPQFYPGMYAPQQMMPTAPIPTGATGTDDKKVSQDTTSEDQNHKKLVSPMVGTFYSQPSPDKQPFVKVGDKVKKGQTICIIEAMKLMNEIESEHDGEIVKILTNNEDMVEFGQPLFLIR